MKGTYRIYVQRWTVPYDWELVGSCGDADEAWATAKRWEETTSIVAVRVDLCVRHFDRRDAPVPASQGSGTP